MRGKIIMILTNHCSIETRSQIDMSLQPQHSWSKQDYTIKEMSVLHTSTINTMAKTAKRFQLERGNALSVLYQSDSDPELSKEPTILQDEQLASLVVVGWDQLGDSLDTQQSEIQGISHEVIIERALDKKVFKTLHYGNSLKFATSKDSNQDATKYDNEEGRPQSILI